MSLQVNGYQRAVLLVAALLILIIQFAKFSEDGVDGYGWVFSLLVAGILIFLATGTRGGSIKHRVKSGSDMRQRKPLPTKDELAVLHQGLRENAEMLAAEVEHRGATLAEIITRDADPRKHGVALTIGGSRELTDRALKIGQNSIRSQCILLMLGLVGMRQSLGKKVYTTGIEFKTLQEATRGTLLRLSAESQALADAFAESFGDSNQLPTRRAEMLAKSIAADMAQVRKAVTQYCISLESGTPNPERPLLEWFGSKCTVVQAALKAGGKEGQSSIAVDFKRSVKDALSEKAA